MKIISWNSNGGFRNKTEALLSLDADVYCVQECESPEKHEHMFDKKLNGHNIIWKGNDPKKDRGVAIISKPGIESSRLEWSGNTLRDFLPVSISGTDIVIVNVWACKPYIENFNAWFEICRDNINTNTILIGDFNSNKIWDAKHGVLCHSRAIAELNDLGLVSAYHHIMKEEQGEETTPTFYLYKHTDKPYHLDYAFAAPSIIKSFQVVDTEWLDKSDHLPITLEIDEESIKTQSNNMILADDENVDVLTVIKDLKEEVLNTPPEVAKALIEAADRAGVLPREFFASMMEKAAYLDL